MGPSPFKMFCFWIRAREQSRSIRKLKFDGFPLLCLPKRQLASIQINSKYQVERALQAAKEIDPHPQTVQHKRTLPLAN
jgi:D-alanine-D-alanine ligase-like ATP-grasp enzyme